MNKPRIGTIAGIILTAAAFRIIPHPPNFSPVSALALFGGACLVDRRMAFLLPLAAMFLSDLALGFSSVTPVVYASFVVIVCLGIHLRRSGGPARVLTHTLAASLLFFLTTNLAVWVMSGMYPHTASGFAACYIAALPFFQNTLAGDFFYSTALFLGLALFERQFPIISENHAPA